MIDTMTIVRRLEAAKMSREQAEAVAGAIRDGASTSFGELATTSDLEHVHTTLRGDVETLGKDVQRQIDGLRKAMYTALRLLEQRKTIKLGSMLVVAVGVTAALVKRL